MEIAFILHMGSAVVCVSQSSRMLDISHWFIPSVSAAWSLR